MIDSIYNYAPDVSKQKLRALFKNMRKELSEESRDLLDTALCANITTLNSFINADTLLAYYPVKGEPDVLNIVRSAYIMGKRVAFPISNSQSYTLSFRYVDSLSDMVEGAYGIPEPPDGAPLCQPTEHSLCILPALTFDLSGARLGYGKGYYDRFLATFPGVAVGAIYSSLLVRRVPTEPHDRPVALLFTEHECWDCRLAPPAQAPCSRDGDTAKVHAAAAFPGDPLRCRVSSS